MISGAPLGLRIYVVVRVSPQKDEGSLYGFRPHFYNFILFLINCPSHANFFCFRVLYFLVFGLGLWDGNGTYVPRGSLVSAPWRHSGAP
jgi:hypothetical protein